MMQMSGVENIREEIIKLWKHYSGLIKEAFGLQTTAYPANVKEIEEKSESPSFGGRLQEDTLFIYSEVIDGVIPLRALIAKLCLKSAMSWQGICRECMDDLSTEFGRQTLEGSEQRFWEERWSLQSPRRKLSTVLVHDPSFAYPNLYRLVGSEGMESLVSEIIAMEKHGIVLHFEDYLSFLQTRFRRFSAKLSATDLKIINLLLLNRRCDQYSLANELGISPEWVSRRISSLQKKSILRRFVRTPFSRIGIRMFHLLLSVDKTSMNKDTFLSSCPFLYGSRAVLTGPWDVVATIAIPDNAHSVTAMEKFQQSIGRRGVTTKLMEIMSSGTARCFDYYDVELGKWEIPWELLEVQIRKIYNDELGPAFPRVDKTATKTGHLLDRLDIRILDEARKGNSSVDKVRKALRIGQERAAKRLRRLKSAGLIVATWEVHNIGLNECVFLVCEDRRTSDSIAAWIQRLPMSIVSFDSSRRLLLMTRLPKGGCVGMASALSSLSPRISIDILATSMYGSWGFPADLWDPGSQNWLFPKMQTDKWLSVLE